MAIQRIIVIDTYCTIYRIEIYPTDNVIHPSKHRSRFFFMISQQCNYIALYFNHQYLKVHYFLKLIFCDNFAIKGAQCFRIFPHSSFVKIKYIALRLVKREDTNITAPSSSLKALLQRSPLQQCKVHSINAKPLQVS